MAPKRKGKGKGDKLARMTVEQRQHYLERRAAQEAESNRRKEELVAGFLKLKLADEELKGGVNQAKLMSKWRQVLRQVKTSSLRTQLQEIRIRVTEATTQQDRLIHLLASQVDQAQQQRTQAAQNHLSATRRLTELHEEHVGLLTQHVRAREADVSRAMAGDTEHLAATHLQDLRDLSLVVLATQRHHDLTEKEELAAFHTTMTQVTTQLEEEVAAARLERESALEEAWARLAISVKEHDHQVSSLRTSCHQLQSRVSTNHKNLNTINHTIGDMQSEVEALRKKLRKVGKPSAAAQELERLKKTVRVLRDSLSSQRHSSRTVLKAINNRGYDTKKQLEEMLREGRAVLEMASACSRLETQRDRNLPFLPQATLPSVAAATAANNSLRPPLVAAPAPDHERLGRILPHPHPTGSHTELEVQVVLSSETDEGLGTSLNSWRGSQRPPTASVGARLKRADSVLETVEGSSIEVPAAFPTTTASSSSSSSLLPRLPHSKGPTPRRNSGLVSMGRDKLSRISELLNHEEAAHEAAHTLGVHDTLEPLPDFVLQEADAVLKTHDDLHNFWRKHHHVQLERLALRSEGEALREEGRHLRALLRQYFVSLGMTDAALAQSSAPITVSQLGISVHHHKPRERRSRSVPAGSVAFVEGGGGGGCRILTACSDEVKWTGLGGAKAPFVQEARLLVQASALHSASRVPPLPPASTN